MKGLDYTRALYNVFSLAINLKPHYNQFRPKATFTDMRNLILNFQLFHSLVYFVLPFTDLRNSSYQKKFSLHKVELLQKLAKKT